MIISGGSNVYAVEVEQVLATHPLVGEVAVVGVADDLWGELVVAVIVPADCGTIAAPDTGVLDTGVLDTGVLDAHCRQTLAGYKVPRRYVSLDALPRNAYGKVLKRELRELLS